MATEVTVRGLAEAKAAFKALPEIARDALAAATETTVREIVRGAQARILASPSIYTRALYDHIGWSMNKNTGRGRAGVGSGSFSVATPDSQRQRKGRANIRIKGTLRTTATGRQIVVRPSRYAHFVEFGTRHMRAEPFMIPAAEAQRQPYLDRAKAAGRVIEQNTANIGMRNL
jgi:HK97 gp10 family phage protein